jgi:hypothetical protein
VTITKKKFAIKVISHCLQYNRMKNNYQRFLNTELSQAEAPTKPQLLEAWDRVLSANETFKKETEGDIFGEDDTD